MGVAVSVIDLRTLMVPTRIVWPAFVLSIGGAVFLSVLSLGGAAILGILMGLAAPGARGRGAKVPFGPALVAGAFACIALSEPILDAFE